MKNAIYFLLSFFLFGIFACGDTASQGDSSNTDDKVAVVQDDGSVTRIWKLKEIDRSGFSDEDNPLKINERKMRSKGYYISLFPDNTGTIIEHSECEKFEWTLDEAANKIIFKKKPKYTAFKELDIVRKDGKTELVAKVANAGSIIMESYSKTAQYIEEDPFHPNNNLWRFRKMDNESKQELTVKADNYLQHVLYLFKARIDNPDRRFSTVNSSGVLNIYDGGIGVTPKAKISEDWNSYFYTKEQALEAWKIVRKRVGKNTLRSKRGGDWILENYKVLAERLEKESGGS